jgi:hypothetical protein
MAEAQHACKRPDTRIPCRLLHTLPKVHLHEIISQQKNTQQFGSRHLSTHMPLSTCVDLPERSRPSSTINAPLLAMWKGCVFWLLFSLFFPTKWMRSGKFENRLRHWHRARRDTLCVSAKRRRVLTSESPSTSHGSVVTANLGATETF